MLIGKRLRVLREQRKYSQGEIEKRTGLLRCYISRVENGHTVPAVETLEKFAHALEIPMYQLFYDGEEPPKFPTRNTSDQVAWGSSGKDARLLSPFRGFFGKINEADRKILPSTARKIAGSSRARP